MQRNLLYFIQVADYQPQPRRARGKNRALPGFLLLFLSTAGAADETPLPYGADVLKSYAKPRGMGVPESCGERSKKPNTINLFSQRKAVSLKAKTNEWKMNCK